VTDLRSRCETAMNDDFNTPILISVLFDAVKNINLVKAGQQKIDEANKTALIQLFDDYLFKVMGLQEESNASTGDDLGSSLMEVLIEMRKEARTNKDFALSDAIRDKLASLQISLKDGTDGTTWAKGS
jgi:cysteinyl-tRNA synthetase